MIKMFPDVSVGQGTGKSAAKWQKEISNLQQKQNEKKQDIEVEQTRIGTLTASIEVTQDKIKNINAVLDNSKDNPEINENALQADLKEFEREIEAQNKEISRASGRITGMEGVVKDIDKEIENAKSEQQKQEKIEAEQKKAEEAKKAEEKKQAEAKEKAEKQTGNAVSGSGTEKPYQTKTESQTVNGKTKTVVTKEFKDRTEKEITINGRTETQVIWKKPKSQAQAASTSGKSTPSAAATDSTEKHTAEQPVQLVQIERGTTRKRSTTGGTTTTQRDVPKNIDDMTRKFAEQADERQKTGEELVQNAVTGFHEAGKKAKAMEKAKVKAGKTADKPKPADTKGDEPKTAASDSQKQATASDSKTEKADTPKADETPVKESGQKSVKKKVSSSNSNNQDSITKAGNGAIRVLGEANAEARFNSLSEESRKIFFEEAELSVKDLSDKQLHKLNKELDYASRHGKKLTAMDAKVILRRIGYENYGVRKK
ncbi:hypothetical protein IJG72_03775 [bacterium]|nr:hypothetical protein [bacterium]